MILLRGTNKNKKKNENMLHAFLKGVNYDDYGILFMLLKAL